MSIKDNYYTLSEAAAELNVSRQTLFRWIKNKKIPAEKVGRENLIEKSIVAEQRLNDVVQFATTLVNWQLDAEDYKPIREYFGYNTSDKIKMIDPVERILLVTRSDGSKEKIEVGPVEIKYNEKARKIEIEVVPQEIKKSVYKERKKGIRAKKTK